MENLLMDYVLAPDLAHRLARVATDHTLELLDLAVDLGADFLGLEGDLAYNSGPFMDPRHYDDFIGPYHNEIVDFVHGKGLKIFKHTDGDMSTLIPSFLDAGFDGLHPFEPLVMDIAENKKKYGDRACILGNIDCTFLLVNGTPEEVRESVRETIAKTAPGGGYIITSSNSVHSECRPENYIAMVKAVREFGDYANLPEVS